MSADNGIYILETDGPEYRVAHLQAVENVYWDDAKKELTDDESIILVNAREMWKNRPVFENRDSALRMAADLLKLQPICEYGISFIKVKGKF